MRILFCTNSLGAAGGIQRVTTVKANALAEIEGNDVAICYTDKGRFPDFQVHPLSRKVRAIDLKTPFWDLYPLNLKNITFVAPKKFYQCYKNLRKLITDINPDVIISTGSYEKYSLAIISLLDRFRKRKRVFIREFHFGSTYRIIIANSKIQRFSAQLVTWIEKQLIGNCFDMNFLLTKEDKTTNFKNVKKFDFMHNPTSFCLPTKEELNQFNKTKTIVAVGRLTSQKWFEALLEAWAKALESSKCSDWKLRIIGDGSDRAKLQDLAKSLGISKFVEFVGHVNNVDDYLKEASIICTTSRYEGLQLGLIEAMGFGCVPIAFKTPYGPLDVITDGVNGFLTELGDTTVFADKIVQLVIDSGLRESMSYNAYCRAHDFCIDSIIGKWMEKYNELRLKKS